MSVCNFLLINDSFLFKFRFEYHCHFNHVYLEKEKEEKKITSASRIGQKEKRTNFLSHISEVSQIDVTVVSIYHRKPVWL